MITEISYLLDYSQFSHYIHLITLKRNFLQNLECRKPDEHMYMHPPNKVSDVTDIQRKSILK